MTTTRSAADAEIRRMIDAHAAGVHDRDVDAASRHADPDILVYDLAPPLRTRGSDTYRKNLAEWFPTWDGPIGSEMRELEITAGDDVAFATCLNRISGVKRGGEEVSVWVRTTLGLRRVGGRWTVTHEHVSTPFYMDGSVKAAVDLQP
jgi:PhnB protein